MIATQKKERVCILGAGGHARVVLSTLQALGYTSLVAFDDAPEKVGGTLGEIPIGGDLGTFESKGDALAVIAVGDNKSRRAIAQRFPERRWLTLIHPYAFVDPAVTLGPGTVVFAGAVIQPETVVGSHAIINTSATVDHHCLLGDFVHVAPGVRLAGDVRVADGVLLGVGSVLVPGVDVGPWTVVGAGSTVVRDLPGGVVAHGGPARVVHKRS